MKLPPAFVLAVFAPLAVLPATGCRGAPQKVDYARPYPRELKQTHVADIQVFRRGTKIEFTNTTVREFGKSTLWLNQQFSWPIEGLGVGKTMVVSLKKFKDENSETFRAGGFLSTEPPQRVVMAQIEPTSREGHNERARH